MTAAETWLSGCQRVHLQPQGSFTVCCDLPPAILALYDWDGQWTGEPGIFAVLVVAAPTDIQLERELENAVPPDDESRMALGGSPCSTAAGFERSGDGHRLSPFNDSSSQGVFMNLSRTLITSSVIAALGGLLFGFDTAVISGAEQRLEELFQPAPNLSTEAQAFWHGFLVASALVGTIVGAMGVGGLADRYGRRGAMFGLAALFFISAVGSALAWDWYSFVVFRFVGGLGVGGASVVSPMYIAEISPARVRGRLVALAQLNIVVGILAAFVSNYIVGSYELGETEWRWMFGVEAIPAALFFLLLFFTPRSPRWLVAQGQLDEARTVLERVGVDEQQGTVDNELEQIGESIEIEHQQLKEPFFQRKYLRPILLAVAIAAFNQLSGINAVLYYSRRIFDSAGFGESASLLNSVGLGTINLIFTVIALFLLDRIGRKMLMIVGSIGYIASLGVTAWAFYTMSTLVTGDDGAVHREITQQGGMIVVASLLMFIASHAVGQGAVIWVFLSEIFPNRVRARGLALGCFTHWVFAAGISQTFPLIAEKSGGNVFAFYAACMVGQLLWVMLVMPETKGIPLEEIQKRLHIE